MNTWSRAELKPEHVETGRDRGHCGVELILGERIHRAPGVDVEATAGASAGGPKNSATIADARDKVDFWGPDQVRGMPSFAQTHTHERHFGCRQSCQSIRNSRKRSAFVCALWLLQRSPL